MFSLSLLIVDKWPELYQKYSVLLVTASILMLMVKQGMFAARFREICMELTRGEAKEQWCCEMVDSASATNQVILSCDWSIL